MQAYDEKIRPYKLFKPEFTYLEDSHKHSINLGPFREPITVRVGDYDLWAKTNRALLTPFLYLFAKPETLNKPYLWNAFETALSPEKLDEVDVKFLQDPDSVTDIQRYEAESLYDRNIHPCLKDIIPLIAKQVPLEKIANVNRIYVTTTSGFYDCDRAHHVKVTVFYVLYN